MYEPDDNQQTTPPAQPAINNDDPQSAPAVQDESNDISIPSLPASEEPATDEVGDEPQKDNDLPMPVTSDDNPATDQDDDDNSEPELSAINSVTSSPSAFTPPAVKGSDDLHELKQQALQALSPVVDHLDQTPEEKFNTTMMMIQATENKELLSKAYEAAQAIPDEKVKAQALLDVVNEINYFSQPHDEK